MRYLLLALLVLVACEDPFGPDIPTGVVPMEPHRLHFEYWDQVEKDSGHTGDIARIQWFEVTGGPWRHKDGTVVRGMWVRNGHRIYLAAGHTGAPPVVKHEILHDLLGDPSHDHPLFSTAAYKRSPY